MTDPSKLKPEEVEEAAFELAAKHLQNVLGAKISPEDVLLGRRATPNEQADTRRAQAEQLERAAEAMTPPEELRQILIVNWLFPAIGKLIRGRNTFLPTGDMAREIGFIALNDEAWAAFSAAAGQRAKALASCACTQPRMQSEAISAAYLARIQRLSVVASCVRYRPPESERDPKRAPAASSHHSARMAVSVTSRVNTPGNPTPTRRGCSGANAVVDLLPPRWLISSQWPNMQRHRPCAG